MRELGARHAATTAPNVQNGGDDTTAQPAAGRTRALPVDRLSAADQMALLLEGRTTPLVGAMLVLGASGALDPTQLRALVERRLTAVPRLRQRPLNVPFGCGRPIWVDDPAFEITDHLSVVGCPAPGGQEAALAVAASLLAARLSRSRPLWVAAIVTGMQGGQTAVIIALHHALADGMGALAVLSAIVDSTAVTPDPDFPRPGPTRAQLRVDAARQLVRDVSALPATLVGGVQALFQFAPVLRSRLAPSSLNRRTGPDRRFLTASCSLAVLHDVAHAQGATINDAVVSAVAGALSRLLAGRGETLNTIVVSVPVSLRRSASLQSLGNQTGVMLLRLPATGAPLERLRSAATLSRAAKRFAPEASNALFYWAFSLLAQLGLYEHFIDHQRVNHTFVTDLKGPETRLSLGGIPVVDLVALSTHSGNVTVSFAVLSYAGTLTVTLIADPLTCPDQDRLQTLLVNELARLTGTVG
ncbi:wax ester/triacylglycerol synthase domain-containing protein [Deinococcus sp. UYEF24]